MDIFIYSVYFIFGLYFLTLAIFIFNWLSEPLFSDQKTTPSTSVSIIIAARNEEKNIVMCIQNIIRQDYPFPLAELIIVDDNSTDTTIEVCKKELAASPFTYSILKLSKSNLKGKKSALQKGIEASRGDLIITIDADSNPAEKTWIKTFVSCYEQKKSKLIIAPISLRKDDGFLNGFESIDVLGLSLTTAGSAISGNPIMCNGANLSFDRQAFCEVGGYLGNENVSSGDDVFLLNKIHAKYPGLVHYLKSQDAIVLTDGNKNLNSFIAQRIRWAGKFSSNKNLFNSYLGVLVFFCNFLFLVFALLSCFFHELANFLIVLALLKWFIDFLLVFLSALFLKQPHVLRWYAISIIVYPFYVCLIAGLSLLVKPKWKGRKI